MLSSHFHFRDISLDQQYDMLKTFLFMKFFTSSTSTQYVALPKAIMKLKIVGISYALLKSQSSIMVSVGSIMQLVRFCCEHFRYDYLILRFKLYERGRTVDFFLWPRTRMRQRTCVVLGFLIRIASKGRLIKDRSSQI